MSLLSLRNITKRYDEVNAVVDLSLEIERGEIFGLLGPSGSGKTTLLRLIAGLATPDEGSIEFEGKDIKNQKTEQRRFGMVFQSHTLFPHLNVNENVAFGLKSRKLSKSDINEQVQKMLSLVRLSGYEKRRVEELSGGEQQRVAIARALAIEPHLLLFDEPFSNLDVGLRQQMREELRELINRLNLTAIYVTHDQDEAFALCERIGIMQKGSLIETGEPRELYERPVKLSVASFLGKNNLFQAVLLSNMKDKTLEFKTLDGDHCIFASLKPNQQLGPINKPVTLAIRPEAVKFFSGASFPADNVLRAKVTEINYAGPTTTVKLDVSGLKLEALVLRLVGLGPGDDIMVGLPPDSINVLYE